MRKLPLRRSLSNMGSPVLSCSVPSLRGQPHRKVIDSHLRGMKFVGLMEAIRQVTERPVDVFDVTHIERGSPLDWEIHATGITIFENAI